MQKKLQTLVKKITHHAFALFGRDSLSGQRIFKRSDLREVGTRYGGWVVPSSLLSAESICYCVGCGEDISFDLELIKSYGCTVHGFDPTPRAIEYVKSVADHNNKYRFFDVGLWDKDDTLKFFAPQNPTHVSHSLVNLQKTSTYISVRVKRLSELMRELGHEHLDLLKIDIEGAEYKVIETILHDRLDIRILCVEFDEFFNPLDAGYRSRIRNSIGSLIDFGYTLACAQGNGNYTFVKLG